MYRGGDARYDKTVNFGNNILIGRYVLYIYTMHIRGVAPGKTVDIQDDIIFWSCLKFSDYLSYKACLV